MNGKSPSNSQIFPNILWSTSLATPRGWRISDGGKLPGFKALEQSNVGESEEQEEEQHPGLGLVWDCPWERVSKDHNCQ